MNSFEKNIKEEESLVRLSDAEKHTMRMALRNSIQDNPLSVPSPVSLWDILSRGTGAIASSAALAAVLLGSTAYAAQRALPGDPLYPVKIYIDEPVRGSCAFSPEAKAAWHTNAAEERIKEAQRLASQQKLSSAALQEIQSNFDTHVTAALQLVPQVATTDAGAAAQLYAQIGGSLGANSVVLSHIADRQGNTETRDNSKLLASHIMQETAIALSPQDTASSTLEHATVQVRALKELDGVETTFNAVRSTLDATTSPAFEENIVQARALANAQESASSTYQTALETGVILKAYLEANKEFDGGILMPLLHTSATPPAAVKKTNSLHTEVSHKTSAQTATSSPPESKGQSSASVSETSRVSEGSDTKGTTPGVVQELITTASSQ